MKKKFFAIYALAGALVASPVFTSCVDDSVSESVEALRNANTQYKKAQTAQTEANTAIMQANAALQQEAQRIANELAAAQLAHEKAMNAYEEALKEKQNEKELEELRIALEAALRAEEIAKAKAEAALEAAKLEAERQLLWAQQQHMAAQAEMDKYIAGLEAAKKQEVNKINGNVDAIMNGGSYYAFDGYEWNFVRTYANNYSAYNDYNSIVALTQGLVTESVNLHGLKNDLVDIEEYIAEEKTANEEVIALNEALIAKYTELQKTSSREALEKSYKEATEKVEAYDAELAELNVELSKAQSALTVHNNGMASTAIAGANWQVRNYLSYADTEYRKDTLALENGNQYVASYIYSDVYEHTEEDAEDLANAIAQYEEGVKSLTEQIEAKKEEIAEFEANMAKVNATELQRLASVYSAKLAEAQKAYDDVLATQAYKDKVAALEKAVADAQAAFNANPTSFTEYQYNEDGTPKVDANGQQEVKYGTKELLQQAEAALADVVEYNNYNYGTEAEPKWLSNLYNELYSYYYHESYDPAYWYGDNGNIWSSSAYWGNLVEITKKLNDGVEINKLWAEDELNYKADELEDLNEDLEWYTEQVEKYKEIQAMLAPTSDEMKEYAALVAKRVELEDAIFDVMVKQTEVQQNKNYYNSLISTLYSFVGDEYYDGSLPKYAELIEEAEEAIKEAKEAIAELEYNGNGKLNKEAAIAKKEAEIAAIEAELKIRQAEFEAELAELEALVDVEEEEEEVPAE